MKTDEELAEKIMDLADNLDLSKHPKIELEKLITTHLSTERAAHDRQISEYELQLTTERAKYREALVAANRALYCHRLRFDEYGVYRVCKACDNCKALALIQPLLKK